MDLSNLSEQYAHPCRLSHMREFLIGWFVATNVLAWALIALDKLKARRRARRIPEAQLILVAAAGGAPASWIACSVHRHKTRKRSFQAKLSVASLICLALLWFAWPTLTAS